MNQLQSKTIFVVDDDQDIRELLSEYLEAQNFCVQTADGALQLDQMMRQNTPDLIVLDVMLPGEDGYSICRRLSAASDIPILMLTANSGDTDRIIGLELGADDYMEKPFNPRELLARVRAILRRTEPRILIQPEETVEQDITILGRWQLNHQSRALISDSGEVWNISGSDYNLLNLLIDNRNEVVSRDYLYQQMKGRDATPFDRSLDVQISRLRQKLGDDGKNPQLIKTIRGVGYVLAEQLATS